jgi:hypothetical protein
MPGHYGLKKGKSKMGPAPKRKTRSTPMKDSGKRMTPAMKEALKKRLGKK